MSTDACGDASRGPEFIRAVFEVVTPMFLGGAVPEETVELRPASIKGALRFWWRALAWGRHWNQKNGAKEGARKPDAVLREIWKEEACLFGSAAATGERGGDKEAKDNAARSGQEKDHEGRGQASFLLRAGWETQPRIVGKDRILKVGKGKNGSVVGPGARYLGYGLMEAFDNRKKNRSAGQLTRPCIREGARFWVELIPRRRGGEKNAGIDPTIIDALKLFGLIGGLGARTRRGWGSVRLLSLRCGKGLDAEADGGAPNGCGCALCSWKPPANEKEFLSCVQDILTASEATANGTRSGLPPGEPPYSAFARDTRVVIAPLKAGNALSALNHVGEQMRRYRGWRPPGEKRFEDDHDWFVSIPDDGQIRRDQPKGHPRRVIFGLPHNYFGKHHEPQKAGVLGEQHDRRASPLFIHIGKFGGGGNAGGGANARARYFAVLTVFPSQFLPNDERLWIWRRSPRRPGRLHEATLRDVSVDWDVLHQFIDGKSKGEEDNGESNPYFPNNEELWPTNTGDS
ncbi:MAG: hypothetical protein KatS3mg119_1937 [Rhodothalassiaceae bacterium]|nr:MAG: hypothetical protein KatS3mg119_1937 [Rhodothalassiaceae bacterium]